MIAGEQLLSSVKSVQYLFNELQHYSGTSDQRLRTGGYEVPSYVLYEQSTGQLTLVDGLSGMEVSLCGGYAGRGWGFNNHDAQNEKDIGPLPEGNYRIGQIQTNTVRAQSLNPRDMEFSMRLTPMTNIDTRSGFLIHDDFGVRNASNGCICTPKTVRQAIAGTGVRLLQVVP